MPLNLVLFDHQCRISNQFNTLQYVLKGKDLIEAILYEISFVVMPQQSSIALAPSQLKMKLYVGRDYWPRYFTSVHISHFGNFMADNINQ